LPTRARRRSAETLEPIVRAGGVVSSAASSRARARAGEPLENDFDVLGDIASDARRPRRGYPSPAIAQ
jgi:hypothetical protein